jgi:hypothetical protein
MMLAKIKFHEIDSWNLVEGTSKMYATIQILYKFSIFHHLFFWPRIYLKYRYLATVFHKHGHLLKERLENLNRLNSERCMKGFALVAQFTFLPSRTYAQYDLVALVSVPEIDKTMTDALASVDKSMYSSKRNNYK